MEIILKVMCLGEHICINVSFVDILLQKEHHLTVVIEKSFSTVIIWYYLWILRMQLHFTPIVRHLFSVAKITILTTT